MKAAIQIDNLDKIYPGEQHALKSFSLTVNEGEIFGFLGPNGAGKTTTIKILLGLLKATAGSVRVLGNDPAKPAARRQIGYLPETANYYEFMNVIELLRFYGTLCDLTREQLEKRIEEMLELVGLTSYAKRRLGKYSKGMLQRAGIAQALLHDPQLLILDEPMTGLDPLARLQMREIILSLRKQGKTVFFSSHELSESEVVCDRFGIVRNGELCWCGHPSEMIGDAEVNLERIFLRMIREQDKT